jgi:putative FmdB family regulatory protein
MPTYEYLCEECEHKLEVFQKITEVPYCECPACGKKTLKRGPGGGIGLTFEGSGFYKTDYRLGTSPKKETTTAKEPTESKESGDCCPCSKGKNSCTNTI